MKVLKLIGSWLLDNIHLWGWILGGWTYAFLSVLGASLIYGPGSAWADSTRMSDAAGIGPLYWQAIGAGILAISFTTLTLFWPSKDEWNGLPWQKQLIVVGVPTWIFTALLIFLKANH